MSTVTLRKRPGANDKQNLYLDYYPAVYNPVTRRYKRREALHMSIYTNPKTTIEKAYNKKIMELAEVYRCKRSIEVSSNELGIWTTAVQNSSFLDFFHSFIQSHPSWKSSYIRFSDYVGGECTFKQITVDLCNGFKDYLHNATVLSTHGIVIRPKKISHNTAVKDFIIFRRILKEAYKANKLKKNINLYIQGEPYKKTQRNYLTKREVRILWDTPCRYGVLKDASMFSIFTGLRISDILTLNWDEIQEAPDGKPCIKKRFQKTDIETMVFISEEALCFCGPRRPGELVFKDLRRSMVNQPLQEWMEATGINKHITFHCFRHTNATLMLAAGINIYTVSNQLTHTSIKTTQIYGHLVDDEKRKASEIISLDFLNEE